MLAPRTAYVESLTPTQVKLIGTVELAAALGVVFPAATGILPVLTPIAAVGIVAIMVGAMITHLVRKEPALIVPNIILGSMAGVRGLAALRRVRRRLSSSPHRTVTWHQTGPDDQRDREASDAAPGVS